MPRLYSRLEYYGRGVRKLMYIGDNGFTVEEPVLKPYAFFVKRMDLISKANSNRDIFLSDTDYRDEYGNRVMKYEVDGNPKLIARYRDNLFGYDNTREADIKYVLVLLKDKYYEVVYDIGNVAYIDIEADDKDGFPQPRRNKIVCITAKMHGEEPVWFYIGDYDTEVDMIRSFLQYLRERKATLLVGWNIAFDYSYLTERMRAIGVRDAFWKLVIPIDMHDEYKANVKGLSSYTLLEVAEKEKLEGYPIKKAAEGRRIYTMSRKELMEYNVNDACMLEEIENRYGFIETKVAFSKRVNITIDLMTPINVADVRILRRMRSLGYVAINRRKVKPKPYKGAAVLKPPMPGLYRNVVELDFESMYPNIIINEKIDVGRFKGEILPHILSELLQERRKYKKLYKETGDKKYDILQKAIKIEMNMIYGLFGQPYFRYYDYEKASAVTRKGRELLQYVKSIVEEHGNSVLYGDTDSVFIQVMDADTAEQLVEKGKALAVFIDALIYPYHIKFEAAGDILFLRKANANEPAKKRYILRTVDGGWIIRGIEVRRSDWDELTKEVVWNIIEMVFAGKSYEEIIKYIDSVKRGLFAGKYDEKLIMSKGFDPNKAYKVNTEHVRAYRKLVKRLGVAPRIDRVMYVYVGKDVEPLLSETDIDLYRGKLNYRRYWERLSRVLDRILKSVYGGAGWKQKTLI